MAKCDTCNNRVCKDAYPPYNTLYAKSCIERNYLLYVPNPEDDETKYQKECPFCASICSGFKEHNLFCSCSGKYYYDDQCWYQRSSGKVVFEKENATIDT